MDTGRSVPFLQSGKDVVGNLLKPGPIQVLALRKILLIAMFAVKITEIGDMPLNMKWIIH
jgi:hypothetical protein